MPTEHVTRQFMQVSIVGPGVPLPIDVFTGGSSFRPGFVVLDSRVLVPPLISCLAWSVCFLRYASREAERRTTSNRCNFSYLPLISPCGSTSNWVLNTGWSLLVAFLRSDRDKLGDNLQSIKRELDADDFMDSHTHPDTTTLSRFTDRLNERALAEPTG